MKGIILGNEGVFEANEGFGAIRKCRSWGGPHPSAVFFCGAI